MAFFYFYLLYLFTTGFIKFELISVDLLKRINYECFLYAFLATSFTVASSSYDLCCCKYTCDYRERKGTVINK